MNTAHITVETTVTAPLPKVWEFWTKPEHIVNWSFATDDWEAPAAENDLRVGGTFRTVMSAKDKSASFDFAGVYTNVVENSVIEYDMSDGRHVKIVFTETPSGITVTTTFDPENENPAELQRSGWQAIADNFKKYVEASN